MTAINIQKCQKVQQKKIIVVVGGPLLETIHPVVKGDAHTAGFGLGASQTCDVKVVRVPFQLDQTCLSIDKCDGFATRDATGKKTSTLSRQ